MLIIVKNPKRVIKKMRRGDSLFDTDTDYCKNSLTGNKNDDERRKPLRLILIIEKIPKQVIKMMRRGESLPDSDTDYCKNSQTSNKNDEERRKPL